MVGHKGTYLILFSHTAGRGWAFDRNYHYLGFERERWADIPIGNIRQVERGVYCDHDLPDTEAQEVEDLAKRGHIFHTVWTDR